MSLLFECIPGPWTVDVNTCADKTLRHTHFCCIIKMIWYLMLAINILLISMLFLFLQIIFFYSISSETFPLDHSETRNNKKIQNLPNFSFIKCLVSPSHPSSNIISPSRCPSSRCFDNADNDSVFPPSEYFVVRT